MSSFYIVSLFIDSTNILAVFQWSFFSLALRLCGSFRDMYCRRYIFVSYGVICCNPLRHLLSVIFSIWRYMAVANAISWAGWLLLRLLIFSYFFHLELNWICLNVPLFTFIIIGTIHSVEISGPKLLWWFECHEIDLPNKSAKCEDMKDIERRYEKKVE